MLGERAALQTPAVGRQDEIGKLSGPQRGVLGLDGRSGECHRGDGEGLDARHRSAHRRRCRDGQESDNQTRSCQHGVGRLGFFDGGRRRINNTLHARAGDLGDRAIEGPHLAREY